VQSGRVIQNGTYDQLASTAGAFQDLIRRQLI
jgi:hypothetical protein